jgi:methylase of polypeptide subunit release factors
MGFVEMSEDERFQEGDQLLLKSQTETFPYEMEQLGLPFVVHTDVFSPKYFPQTEAVAGLLPFVPGLRVLEVGSGIGVISVAAARAGAARVLATDINPAAVANTRENLARHAGRVPYEVRTSDVYSNIDTDEQFDLIFWNSPWLRNTPDSLEPLQLALVDPGFAAQRRFIQDGQQRLAPDGRLMLSYSSTIGDITVLRDLCQDQGIVGKIVDRFDTVLKGQDFAHSVEIIEYVRQD